MNDLLGYSPMGKASPSTFEEGDGDLEGGRGAGGGEEATDSRLQSFFDEVDDVKESMKLVERKLQSLKAANADSKMITRAADMKALKERMECDIDEVLKTAQRIKQMIEGLDRGNLESRLQPGCGAGTSTDRTRMSITGTLKNKLKGIMEEFQDLRAKMQDEYRDVVERRYYTVTGKRPDAETVEHLIETGDSESIFQKAIQEQGRGKLLDTMAEIQERHNAVRDIEKQLLELHQIFMDMAVLVDSQGELLDNIEVQVGQAVDHVQGGTKQLVEARNTQKNTRKWLCCGIVAVIIIIVAVVVVVVKPWQIKGT